MLFHSSKTTSELKLIHLNQNQKERREALLKSMKADDKQKGLSLLKKLIEKKAKEKVKNKLKKDKTQKLKAFVLDFDGDMKASSIRQLREEVSSLISIAKKDDEVVLRLESPGGIVHAYGLAAAQLARLKEAGINLTICVDKVAASGGYMMACVADKIYSAPFAVVGSIGVVAQMPNFNKLLKNHDVDYELFTAGDFKRTVTVLGENTDADKAKFQEEIEQTHQLFKDFVNTYRPSLDIKKVATGEHWYGEDAIQLGLVDEIKTSDSYLLELMEHKDVYALHAHKKPTLAEKLGITEASEVAVSKAMDKIPEVIAKIEQSIHLK